MTLSDILISLGIDTFAAIRLADCKVTKERLLDGADTDELYSVMLVLPYPKAPKGSPFASFSVIADYHLFFTRTVSEKLSGQDVFHNKYMKVFADHSPIDERYAAASAGLGVIGDNGLFISYRHGSFVFLGEIVCSLTEDVLEREGIPVVTPREAQGCLHCGRCAEACPAGCIGADKTLCISNLTQKKGTLSDTECDMIIKSGMVWGCDVCAEVCPMNEGKAPESYVPYFSRRLSVESREDIERLSDEEYALYPFSWRKRCVIERNFALYGKKSVKGEKI